MRKIGIIILSFIFINSFYAQSIAPKGVSLYGSFLSVIKTSGYNHENDMRPGNFNIGGEYLFGYKNVQFGLGLGFLYNEISGNNSSDQYKSQYEIFASSIDFNINYIFDDAKKYLGYMRIGSSIMGKQSKRGTNSSWILNGEDISIIPIEIGFKYRVSEQFFARVGLATNIGDKIKHNESELNYSSINFGISYNFFSPEIEENDEEIIGIRASLDSCYNSLTNKETKLVTYRAKIDSIDKSLVSAFINLDMITYNYINKKYNLKFAEEIPITDFVNKKEKDYNLTELGIMMLDYYNKWVGKEFSDYSILIETPTECVPLFEKEIRDKKLEKILLSEIKESKEIKIFISNGNDKLK